MSNQVLTSRRFIQWLLDNGTIQAGEMVTRVVIDAQVNDIVRVYVERFGDHRMITVTPPDLWPLTIEMGTDGSY